MHLKLFEFGSGTKCIPMFLKHFEPFLISRLSMLAWAAVLWLSIAYAANVRTNKLKEFQFKHHNNEELFDCMKEIHEKCPNITGFYRLSETSVEGRPLLVLVFSVHPTKHKPSTFIILNICTYCLPMTYQMITILINIKIYRLRNRKCIVIL